MFNIFIITLYFHSANTIMQHLAILLSEQQCMHAGR